MSRIQFSSIVTAFFLICLMSSKRSSLIMGFTPNGVTSTTNRLSTTSSHNNNNAHQLLPKSSSSSTSTTTSLQFSSQAVVNSIGAFYASNPCEAAMITCAVKASVADIVAQVRQHTGINFEEGQPLIELDRNLSFFLYGALYQGFAQHFLYNHLFTDLFGDSHEPLVVATKVMFDMAIIAPNLPLPLSYAIKSIISGKGTVGDGLQKYSTDVIHQDLLFKYWAFWSPVQAISFSVIPDHLRIPFMAAFSFVWMTILSTISSTEATVTKVTTTKTNKATIMTKSSSSSSKKASVVNKKTKKITNRQKVNQPNNGLNLQPVNVFNILKL